MKYIFSLLVVALLISGCGADGESGPAGANGVHGSDGTDGKGGPSGINGLNGTDGKDGQDGTNGVNGLDGRDGQVSLIMTAPADFNDCPDGGFKYMVGVDENNNSNLDLGEISSAVNVCNGADGQNGGDGSNGTDGKNGLTSLTATYPAAVGNCPDGGFKYISGLDDNNDSLLQADEVDYISYVCNGADGMDGSDSNSISAFIECPVVTNPTDVDRICTKQLYNGNWLIEVAGGSSQLLICNGIKFNVISGTWLGIPAGTISDIDMPIPTSYYTNIKFSFGNREIRRVTNSQLVRNMKIMTENGHSAEKRVGYIHRIEKDPAGLTCF